MLFRPIHTATAPAQFDEGPLRLLLLGLVLALIIALGAPVTAPAQPYCAVNDDGTRNCGIPTMEGCRQSVSGVGGICQPDMTSQQRPDMIQVLPKLFPLPDSAPSQNNSPNDPNWMPPPPGQ